MEQVAKADQNALRMLMSRHMRRALTLAERVVGGSVDADDICQEAFIRVWRNAGRFDARRAKFSTWFHRILLNLAIDRTRKQNRLRPIEAAGDPAADQKDAVTGLIEQDQDRVLKTALADLPERQRAAIALFHLEGLSGRDAAETLELSEKAFESLLVRARRSLKARVAAMEKETTT